MCAHPDQVAPACDIYMFQTLRRGLTCTQVIQEGAEQAVLQRSLQGLLSVAGQQQELDASLLLAHKVERCGHFLCAGPYVTICST